MDARYVSPTRVRVSLSVAEVASYTGWSWPSSTASWAVTADGVALTVAGVFAVVSQPGEAEIALSSRTTIPPGVAVAVTSVAGSTSSGSWPGATAYLSSPGLSPDPHESGAPVHEVEAMEYDLRRSGGGYADAGNGDIAILGGRRNVHAALLNRITSTGMAWAPDFGARAGEYKDAPTPAIGDLMARCLRAVQGDDRVDRVSAALDADDPSAPSIRVIPVLRGDNGPATPLNVPVS